MKCLPTLTFMAISPVSESEYFFKNGRFIIRPGDAVSLKKILPLRHLLEKFSSIMAYTNRQKLELKTFHLTKKSLAIKHSKPTKRQYFYFNPAKR